MKKTHTLILLITLFLFFLSIATGFILSKYLALPAHEVNTVGEFTTPNGDFILRIELSNPSAGSSFTTIFYKVNPLDESKEIIKTNRDDIAGRIFWISNNSVCIVYDGRLTNFELGKNCEGEFVDYLDL